MVSLNVALPVAVYDQAMQVTHWKDSNTGARDNQTNEKRNCDADLIFNVLGEGIEFSEHHPKLFVGKRGCRLEIQFPRVLIPRNDRKRAHTNICGCLT